MTKTLTEQWREGKLPEGCYYILDKDGHIKKERTCFYSYTDEQCFCFMSNKDIEEVIAPVPSYEELQSYEKCAGMLIDVNKKWEKTIKERKRLEKRLEIATKALKKIIRDYEINGIGYLCVTRAKQALKEMEGVK